MFLNVQPINKIYFVLVVVIIIYNSLHHFSFFSDKESSQFRSPFDHRRSKSSCGIAAQVESTPKDDINSPRRLSDTALPEKHHQHIGKKSVWYIRCNILTTLIVLFCFAEKLNSQPSFINKILTGILWFKIFLFLFLIFLMNWLSFEKEEKYFANT